MKNCIICNSEVFDPFHRASSYGMCKKCIEEIVPPDICVRCNKPADYRAFGIPVCEECLYKYHPARIRSERMK